MGPSFQSPRPNPDQQPDHDPRPITREQFSAYVPGTWLERLGGTARLDSIRYIIVNDMDISCMGGGSASWWQELSHGSVESLTFAMQRLSGKELPIATFNLTDTESKLTSIQEKEGHKHITKDEPHPMRFPRHNLYLGSVRQVHDESLRETGRAIVIRDQFFSDVVLADRPISVDEFRQLTERR